MSSRSLKVSPGQQSLSIHSFFKPMRDQSASSSSVVVNTPLINETNLPASKISRVEIIQESPSNLQSVNPIPPNKTSSKSRREQLNEENAVSVFQRDPGLRRQISQYPANERNDIRRSYLKLGSYQADLYDEYPRSVSGIQTRSFQSEWFSSFPWLEYSPKNNRAYCFHCFLFPTKLTFNKNGFSSWKRVNNGKKCAFLQHVGSLCSTHQSAVLSCAQLMDPSKHINHLLVAQSKGEVYNNRLRLTTTIKNTLFLALQACAFRGHDESEESKNPGNFLALLKFQGNLNDDVAAVILNNAPKNAKYVSPRIQKEVLHILAERVRAMVRDEVGSAKFSILVDEAQDAADKEQMAIILRFVDGGGFIRERFFKIVSVKNTSVLILKEGICSVLSCYNLHICNIRGQGYDGASNMRGAWNGLQALFCEENPCAYYVHCFAHRLQLALVAAAKDEPKVFWFFSKLAVIVNLIDGSSKRRNELQSFHGAEIEKMIEEGHLQTGKGANQKKNIQRAAATRWSSHIVSIKSVLDMFGAICMVLQSIKVNGSSNTMRGEADGSYKAIKSFKFVFFLHMVHTIMGITDVLCQALQQKSQDILNAICLVSTTKRLLQELRNDGWADFMENLSLFCTRHGIVMPDMSACHKMGSGRTCQQKDFLTNEHYYRIDMFISVIDHQILELEHRFTEEAMEILTLSSSLSPRDSFKSLKIDDICMLAEKYYPRDFTKHELSILRSQLQHYKLDVPSKEPFKSMTKVSQLCRGLVETRKSEVYTLVYRLICLVLTLPVSTATTERVFSAMKIIKTQLRNKMEDDFLGDSMVIYIEREFTDNIDTDSVIDEFALKSRRGQFH